MALARFNANLFDAGFNLAEGQPVTVEVRFDVVGQPLASIFSDREGVTPLSNPRTVTNGRLDFHAADGVYYIRAYTGASGSPTLERIFRYVGISLSQESSLTGLTAKGAWQSTETYSVNDYVTHNTRTFASIQDSNLNNEPPSSDTSDAFWQWIPANSGADGAPGSSDIVATSDTAHAINTGSSKTFTLNESNRGIAAGARVRFSSRADPATNYIGGAITGYVGNNVTILADHSGGTGTFSDWNMNLIGDPGEDGEKGDTGATGPNLGLDYQWDNDTAATAPANGFMKTSIVPVASASATLRINKTDRNGNSRAEQIARWETSSTPNDKGEVLVRNTGDAGQDWCAVVTGALVDETTHFDVPITFTSVGNAIPDNAMIGAQFTRTGDKGTDGAGGDVFGPAGAVSGHFATYNGSTGKLIQDGGAPGALAFLSSVDTAQIVDKAVTNAKLDDMAAHTVKIGPPSGGVPADTAAAVDTILGRQTGGDLGFLDGDKAADILQTGTNPVARRGDNNVYTKAQITSVTTLATWTTAWNIFDNNNFRITGLVSGAAGNFPRPTVTGLAANQVWNGEVKMNTQAGTTAGFDAGWEWPGGSAGVPDLSAGGHFTLYIRIENDGSTTHYEIASVPPWATV